MGFVFFGGEVEDEKSVCGEVRLHVFNEHGCLQLPRCDGLYKYLLLIICGSGLGVEVRIRALLNIHCVIGAVDALFSLHNSDKKRINSKECIVSVISFMLIKTGW